MDFKDYYAILGVARDATAADIKKAFRKQARKYHPDVSKEKDAELRMQEINEANTVLSDPEKRAAYDQLGRGHQPGQSFRPPPDWDAGFEFAGNGAAGEQAGYSDFFAELFGRMGRESGAARGRGFDPRGHDHHAKVLLDLEDAYTGATRQIGLKLPTLDEHGRLALVGRTLNVRIPKGVHEGQMIRLAGQGDAGHGGEPGDLLLEVQFKPHARFRIDGRDLAMTLPVAPWESALGALIPVALPDRSEVQVRLPAGAQSGSKLRVRGKGIPGDPPGDLMLEIAIRVPPADTPRSRELYETMAQEMAFDPRAVEGA